MDGESRNAPVIPVNQIVEADDHVRQASWGDLDELARDLVARGQDIAGLVRPLGDGTYEVIDGARRRRALLRAAELGLLTDPALRCEVREMSAAEAHDARLATAMQREDLSPVEQARAFDSAIRTHHRSVEQVAASVRRSTAYVHQHMRLLRLVPAMRELESRMHMRSLLLIAQLPEAAQRDVAKRFGAGIHVRADAWQSESGPDVDTRFISQADVENELAEITQLLARAPFDQTDPSIDKKAGACSTCPKRSGSQRALFEETNRADVCLDVGCWDRKVAIHKKARTKLLVAEGRVVLDGDESEKARRYGGGYVQLDKAISYEDKRTWAEVVGPDVKVTVAWDEHGREVHLVPTDIANQAIKSSEPKGAKGSKKTKTADESRASDEKKWADERAREKRRKKVAALTQTLAIAALVAHVEQHDGASEVAAPFRRAFVVALVAGMWAETLKAVCARRGWETTGDHEAVISRAVDGLNASQLTGLMIEIVATRTAGYEVRGTGLARLCEHCGIDIAALQEAAEREVDEGKSGRTPRVQDEPPAAVGRAATKRKSRKEIDAEEEAERAELAEDGYGL